MIEYRSVLISAARSLQCRLEPRLYHQAYTSQWRPFHLSSSLSSQPARRRAAGHDDVAVNGKGQKRKPPRSPAANASLRRVALEAERSRGRLKEAQTTGDHRSLVKTDYDTRTVTAFCATEQYNIENVAVVLRNAGYVLDPFHTDLYPQVIHFQMPSQSLSDADGDSAPKPSDALGDVFVFPSGTVVAWDVDEERVQHLIAGALRFAAINAHAQRVETEDLEYYEDPKSEKSAVIGDTIKLGTKPLPSSTKAAQHDEADSSSGESSMITNTSNEVSSSREEEDSLQGLSPNEQQEHRQNLILAKIAFSSGLARSTKVAVLESLLDNYFHNTQKIPSLLSSGSRLPFGRAFMLRKTGELLSVRAQLNLTELTDRLPDLFWDSRHELGLEGYFDHVGRALDVNVRIKTLNERMDYAQEIAAVLRDTLSERHGLLLEWLIVSLIAIEVGVEGWKIWGEWNASMDSNSTENLVHRWLEREMARDTDSS